MKLKSIPIFDPISNSFKYYKDRVFVHKNGNWHSAIQANIIRKNNLGTYDILVQKRSLSVDIGSNKFDQSLATQMCFVDQLSPEITLKRGLLTELGIIKYKFKKIPNTMFIVKTYKEQPEIFNRELLNLFIVKIENNYELNISTPKIKNLYWMEWNKFLIFFNENKNKFTKTSQFYFSNKIILENIENFQNKLIGLNTKKINKNDFCIYHINKCNKKTKNLFFKKKEIDKYYYLFK